MSAIQKELIKATDLDAPKNAAGRQDFLVDLLKAVGKLPDDAWNKLSPEAQNWFNDAADAMNAKAKQLPVLPDMAEEEEEPAPRRRGAAKEEEAAPKAGTKVKVEAEDLKVGMAISLVTKRGKEDTGHVIEVDVKADLLAIKRGDGEEVEYDLQRIESMHTLAAAKEEPTTSRRKPAEADDEPETPELAVGDEVTVTTLRGKEATGEIVEITDDIVVLKEGKEEVEYARERVKSIVPTKPAKATTKKADDAPKRRGAAKDEPEEEGKGKRASNDGVSVGTRIKELIIDDMERTEEDIAKLLKKEGLEFRDNTLKLNFKDTHKFLDLLKAKKMLKA